MNNKLEYLKSSIDSNVFNFLSVNLNDIPNKLLVWFGREIQRKYVAYKNTKSKKEFYINSFVVNTPKLNSEEVNYIKNYAKCIKSNKTKFELNCVDTVKTYIKDWFNGVRCNISKMTLEDAFIESIKWHINIEKNADNTKQYTELKEKDIVFEYQNYKIVNLSTNNDCITEGNKMGHCLGSSDYSRKLSNNYKIYSVRDENNEPHATIEIQISKDNKTFIKQIKGKQNKVPILKYQPIIIQWITTLNDDAVKNCTDFVLFDIKQMLEFDDGIWECQLQFYEYLEK